MAVLHDLQLCWENRFKRNMCYSDSLQTVSLIWDGVFVHHRFANEVVSIRQLFARDWDVVVNHTLREGNACADVLAKMGALASAPLVIPFRRLLVISLCLFTLMRRVYTKIKKIFTINLKSKFFLVYRTKRSILLYNNICSLLFLFGLYENICSFFLFTKKYMFCFF
jgi:hypothetical protein